MNTRSKSKFKLLATNLQLFSQILNNQASFCHLFQFFSLFDTGKIDIVFRGSNEITNKTNYLRFLQILFPRHILSNIDKYWIGESFAKWLMKRQIYLQHIRINFTLWGSSLRDLEWISKFCEFYQNANLSVNPDAKILSLLFMGKCDDEAFRLFIPCCRYLKEINMSNFWNLKNAAMKLLCETCQDLECINLSQCLSINDISLLPRHCPKLEEIDLSQNRNIDDDVICSIKDCLNLQSLNLKYNNSKYFVNLTTLNIYGCDKLTDGDIEHISECVRIKILNISGNGNITDNSIVQIANSCKDLQKFFLSWCYQVTEIAILKIA
jgi:hypothetical protein